ncbi:hypothetical protein BHE74_00032860, partial [Ensete ventricosum]
CRRRRPCADSGDPLRLALPPLLAAAPCGCATGSRPLWPSRERHNRLLLVAVPAALATVGRPCKGAGHGLPTLQVAWPWPATPARGVVVVDRPCGGPGHGWPAPFLAAYAAKMQQERFYASGRSEDNAVGNSPGVHWELAEDIGSLPGWRNGVRRKKTETHQKIIEGSRNDCRELESLDWIGRPC